MNRRHVMHVSYVSEPAVRKKVAKKKLRKKKARKTENKVELLDSSIGDGVTSAPF